MSEYHDRQLAAWLEGTPFCEEGEDCCPDFSCCQPDLLVDRDVRQKFVDANREDRMKFLGMFLGAAMAKAGANVHIAGDEPAPEH
jgi:hypothetical protein